MVLVCPSCRYHSNDLQEIECPRCGLDLHEPVKRRVEAHYVDRDMDVREREWLTEQYNVLEQMRHLTTYPTVRERFKRGTLKVYGWHYIIESGEVYNYNPAARAFEKTEGR